ncbi:MAG TPA: hypothetical protein VL527_09220 [Dongiaceae bacterium]|nr:hypothetical protein [Dongiaceae bacterium]
MKKLIFLLAGLLGAVSSVFAEIPPAEKILPPDTLLMFTIPDCAAARQSYKASTQAQLWYDPAMKPFRDKFMSKLNEELITPLERDLGISLSNYTALAQGQFTIAVLQNGWQGKPENAPGWLCLLDTRAQSDQLKTNLADIKKRWVDAGKQFKTEDIRGTEFNVLLLSTNDIPPTLQKLLPARPAPTFIPEEDQGKTPPPVEVHIGQYHSLLIVGDSTATLEKILRALSGGDAPTLADQSAFAASYSRLFRDTPFYGWTDTKTFLDILNKSFAANADADDAQFSLFKPEQIISGLGLNTIRTVGFSGKLTPAGNTLQVYLNEPEGDRQGIFKIIAGAPKDSLPPAFVPADAIKFSRWRFDGRKTWDNLEEVLNGISPQLVPGLNFALESAGAIARQTDPDFDLKKTLLANLGDDIITYDKPPRSKSAADLATPPSIFLLGSPHPEKITAALKSVLQVFARSTEAPTEREFLGRKIYSIALPSARNANDEAIDPRRLSFAANNSYVAFTTDTAMLEEFLRNGENTDKPLRSSPGFADAAEKVAGSGTSYFSYENQREATRAQFALLKQVGANTDNTNTNAPTDLLQARKVFLDWADFSLLPDFDAIAKYFSFTVTAGGANPEGLFLKIFVPVPPPGTSSGNN